MTELPFSQLVDRLERVRDVNISLTQRFEDYNRACAVLDWKKADAIRVELIEIVEALLDTMAAVYKVNDRAKG